MTPTRLFIILFTIGAALVVTVPVARADYFITQGEAQRFARSEFSDRYGNSDGSLGVACRPQGLRVPRRGFIYHRWVCTWADGSAWGAFLIAGSRTGHDWYNVRLLKGITPL